MNASYKRRGIPIKSEHTRDSDSFVVKSSRGEYTVIETGKLCFHITCNSSPENIKATAVITMIGTAVIIILERSSFICSTSGSSSSPGTEFMVFSDSLLFINAGESSMDTGRNICS